ncbi:MAG: hypothetical protein A2W37_14435 [Chloroflexi bacterium RBG_16_63_12]|nr:MAG: hypothetical protein A2W37_14435 [Chloroflexi bacterium RBG_16_63_12]
MNQSREPQSELTCANCSRRLDPTDKFCRDCGLPTTHHAQAQKLAATPPDTGELKRAFAVETELKPFARPEPEVEPEAEETENLTTGSVVRATNPTFAANLASSTLLMVVVIVLLAIAGLVFLFLAFR